MSSRSGQMTSSDLFKMLRMYERGASAKEISEAVGRSQGVVHTTISRIRKQVNARDLKPETRAKMEEIEQEFIAAWKEAHTPKQKRSIVTRLFPFFRPRN